jgi:hypothetical protein
MIEIVSKSQHVEGVRQCGADVRAFGLRKRKVEAPVVAGVLQGLLRTPFAGPAEWAPLVKAQVGRNDRSVANIAGAWAQSAWVPGRRVRRGRYTISPW